MADLSDDCDDTAKLEQTLVLVAADADARNNEQFGESSTYDKESDKDLYEYGNKGYKRKTEGYDGTHWQTQEKTEDETEFHVARKSKKHEENVSNVKALQPLEEPGVSRKSKRRFDEGNESRDEPSTNKVRIVQENDGIKGHAKIVATHYNTLEEKGLDERSRSRIFHMRNFHNWIKSMLINEYLTKIKDCKKHNEPVRVHDMCCGKGGDLLKWRKGNITHLICSDIASVSLEQCKTRYEDMRNRNFRDRHSGNIYTIECIAADCSRVRLREKYKDASMKLDLVSCQFAFHYSFESLPQAECMIKNAAECLQPGGYFIGTIPDANELMARIHKSGTNSFGNNVYNVTFDCDLVTPPLFGAKYNFHLDGVVDCPEFLVHFPLLVKLAKKHGLKFVKKEKFYDFYMRMKSEGKNLLTNMKSLEVYPPQQGVELVGNADDYEHAKLFLQSEDQNVKIGTLSKSEWEASSLYLTFVFKKVKNTWNTVGDPVYDFNEGC